MEYKRANIITKLNTRAYAKASAFEAGRVCLCSARAQFSHTERRRIMLSPNLLFIFLRRFRTFLLFLQSAGNQFCSTLVRERERAQCGEREIKKRESAGGQWRMKIYVWSEPASAPERGNKTRGWASSSDTHMHDGPIRISFSAAKLEKRAFSSINGGTQKVTRAQNCAPASASSARSPARPLVQEFILYNIFLRADQTTSAEFYHEGPIIMISSRPLPHTALLGNFLFSPSDTKQASLVRAHTYFRAHTNVHLGLIIESSLQQALLFFVLIPLAAVRRFLFLARARAGERERGNTYIYTCRAGRAAYLPLPTLPRSQVEPFLHSLSARRRIMEKAEGGATGVEFSSAAKHSLAHTLDLSPWHIKREIIINI